MARALDRPFSLTHVLCLAGGLLNALRLDAEALGDHAKALLKELI